MQQAVPVEHMADTMGAGDALLTAFLVGYLSRKKKGMEAVSYTHLEALPLYLRVKRYK